MSQIDEDIASFYQRKASLEWIIQDHTKWISEYLTIRETLPDWRTKEGNFIKIKDMTDLHLHNVISYLRTKDPNDTHHWINVFCQEQKYRQLRCEINTLIEELRDIEKVDTLI